MTRFLPFPAQASFDPRSGERRLEVVRLDDPCLSTADELRLAPEEACLTMTATSLARGVERLVFRSRHLNYQVQLTMAQSRGDDAERFGEVSKDQPPPAAAGLYGGHVVYSVLSNDGSGTPSTPPCREGRIGRADVGTLIPVGHSMEHSDTSATAPRITCPLPRDSHCYKLKYELDPFNAWDEGPKGEANNVGWYEGVWCYDGHSW